MRYRSITIALVAASLAGCSGGHSTPPRADVQRPATFSQHGTRVSAVRFKELTHAVPAAGSIETQDTTLHIVDNGTVYIVPSDAIIQRRPTETIVTVGHVVDHLSTKARIVGHGIGRHWVTKYTMNGHAPDYPPSTSPMEV